MKLKKSPYYNEGFLGKYLYENINDEDEIVTIQEYFNIKGTQKEYHIKDKYKDYKLKIYKDYYELNCRDYDVNLFLVFDKPVYIIGTCCRRIIAPEIIIKSSKNSYLASCTANKVTINNNIHNYQIHSSKINNIYFYDSKIRFQNSEVENFYVFNKYLIVDGLSIFLENYKIKIFGQCDCLKEQILNNKKLKQRIIHIE